MISTKYIDRYIDIMRNIQDEILKAFDPKKDSESLKDDLIYNLSKFNILNNNDVFRSFLHLLSKIYENRHQFQDNLKIIESIIIHYKKYILDIFQNCEIFTIFKNDNRLLLFLINSEILKIDKFVINAMKNEKYSSFFFPEIKDFLKISQKSKIEAMMTDDFLEKRQIGENHSYICQLIRNDSIDQFITHISQTNLPLSYEIEDSIFETNSFLIGIRPNLIEYAAYFGSIQIFQYLQTKDVLLTESIWFYAIHSDNSEILQILEDNDVKPQKEVAVKLFMESIACHYNDIASYIYDNYINNNNDENSNDNNDDNNDNNNNNNVINNDNITMIPPAFYFKSYNFAYIETEFINYSNFVDLCEYDYSFFVDRLMKTITPDDLNKKVVKKYNEVGDEYYGLDNNYDISVGSTALFAAVNNDNNEVAKMLLSNDDINANFIYRKYGHIFFNDIEPILQFFSKIMLYLIILPIIPLLFIEYSPATSSFWMKYETLMILILIYIISFFKYPFNINSMRSIFNIFKISSKSVEFIYTECTVLNLACYNNNTEIANLLLSKKDIDVNAKYKNHSWNTQEDTALTLALKNDNNEIVKKLLSNPNIDLNIAYKYQIPRIIPIPTILFIAYSTLFTLLSSLFTLISIINKLVSSKKFTVLFFIFACIYYYHNRHLIPRLLIDLAIGFFICFISELNSSRSFDHILIRTFKFIIRTRNFNFSCYNFFSNINDICLIFAIINILSSLFYTEYAEKSPLHIAIENKNIENAKLLLENNDIDVSSVYKSCIYNFKDKTIDINTYDFIPSGSISYEQEFTNKTALNMAAEIDNAEIVELLLSFKNIDVNAKCKYIVHKRNQLIYLLSLSMYMVESIICILFGRRSNKSTLDIAIENTNVEIVKKLLENNQIKDVKHELEKLKQRQLENGSSEKKVNEQANNETENESKETENRTNEISELLQKFISERQLKQ